MEMYAADAGGGGTMTATATGHLAFNEHKIDDMKTAIDNYQGDIKNVLDQILNYSISGDDGIYGTEQISTISQYVDDTCGAINSIIIMFNEFKTKLADVQAAYDAQQRGITTHAVAQASSASEGDLVNVKHFE